ncbi:Avirulence (Avh) protein [Phytophthora megakarya]|uniref:RxLR effector protein n=1 Tax=Phytophthora megakarya TaxID=4795 RepID=A0A225VUC3_9STRA|nr:Avirulence (Avh) protein [Phytophthora megakarya]
MCFIYTLTLVVAVTLYASTATFPSIEDSKTMIKHAPSSNIVGSDGGRLLRRVEKFDVDDDNMEEERTIEDALKKMNPVTAVKKAT